MVSPRLHEQKYTDFSLLLGVHSLVFHIRYPLWRRYFSLWREGVNGTIEDTLLLFATGEVMSYLVIGREGRLCWEGGGEGGWWCLGCVGREGGQGVDGAALQPFWLQQLRTCWSAFVTSTKLYLRVMSMSTKQLLSRELWDALWTLLGNFCQIKLCSVNDPLKLHCNELGKLFDGSEWIAERMIWEAWDHVAPLHLYFGIFSDLCTF